MHLSMLAFIHAFYRPESMKVVNTAVKLKGWLGLILQANSEAAMRCGMFVADDRKDCCEEAAYSVH